MGQGWLDRAAFWRTPPGELWWIIDAHLPPEKENKASQNERLLALLEDAIEKEAAAA